MLTDTKIRAARPAAKPYRLTDSGGLYLWITPAGSTIWRWRYAWRGREQLASLGPYPSVTLAEARRLRDEGREQLRTGRNPALVRKARRAAQVAAHENNFAALAAAWHAKQAPRWTERHATDVLDSLKKYVFATIGDLPVSEIETPAVAGVLQAIEAAGAPETARRVRQRISAVFVYAAALGLVKNDPAHLARGVLAPVKKGRQPAITDLERLRKMLLTAEEIPAHPVTRLALRLLALTAVRPGELRAARWPEFVGLDGAAPVWEIPAERMKMRVAHTVPLSSQAVEIIRAVKKLTGRYDLVFPSARHAHRPLSENAIGYLLNRAGYHGHHVPHGFRAAFSTIMNESYQSDRQVIDLMLAHTPKNEIEGTYNRALYAPRRRELAQIWADLLLTGFAPADDLTQLKRR